MAAINVLPPKNAALLSRDIGDEWGRSRADLCARFMSAEHLRERFFRQLDAQLAK